MFWMFALNFLDPYDLFRIAIEVGKLLRAHVEGLLMEERWNAPVYKADRD